MYLSYDLNFCNLQIPNGPVGLVLLLVLLHGGQLTDQWGGATDLLGAVAALATIVAQLQQEASIL